MMRADDSIDHFGGDKSTSRYPPRNDMRSSQSINHQSTMRYPPLNDDDDWTAAESISTLGMHSSTRTFPTSQSKQIIPSRRRNNNNNNLILGLFSLNGLRLVAILLLIFTLAFRIKIVDVVEEFRISKQPFAKRENCQIVYVLGVEGSIHHGFTPILQALAEQQVDNKGEPYIVEYANGRLRKALFGLHGETRSLDDETMIRHLFRKICPNDDRKRVFIEDISFPAGHVDETRSYRVKRQPSWAKMRDIRDIAQDRQAINHPTNLYKFVQSYSEYSDIKFVLIHRSFVETIASHTEFDGNVQYHANVIKGFILLISRFLKRTPVDLEGKPLWTLVCMERLMKKYYNGDDERRNISRQRILNYLNLFLGWGARSTCQGCWDSWKDSSKQHEDILGEARVDILHDHMKDLKQRTHGQWPPRIDNGVEEQICNL